MWQNEQITERGVERGEGSEPLNIQLKVFLALPPSKELAKVELAKSNQELVLL